MERLRELAVLKGVPFFVVRGYTRESCKDIVDDMYYGIARRENVGEVLDTLAHSCYDVRITTSFDPDHWFDPETWSKYGYPRETFYREKISGLRVNVLPVNEESMKKFYAYNGFGVVCVEFVLDPVRGMVEKATPVAIVLFEPPMPRQTVVYEEEPELEVHVYTALPGVRRLLRTYGYKPVSEYEMVKKYSSEEEMYRELYEIDNIIQREYDVPETYMLKGLRRRMKRYLKRTGKLPA